MPIRKLNREEWRPFFNGLSKVLQGVRAEIEVVSLALGDQVEAEWLLFFGITYDPKDDIVEIALDGIDHLIEKPREAYVDGDNGIISMKIVDINGAHQIVKLREPLMLPKPA
jgi:Family of unknown function (DUF5335)